MLRRLMTLTVIAMLCGIGCGPSAPRVVAVPTPVVIVPPDCGEFDAPVLGPDVVAGSLAETLYLIEHAAWTEYIRTACHLAGKPPWGAKPSIEAGTVTP